MLEMEHTDRARCSFLKWLSKYISIMRLARLFVFVLFFLTILLLFYIAQSLLITIQVCKEFLFFCVAQ